MKRDGDIPSMSSRKTPSTYYMREFAGGKFPIYVTEEEYDRTFTEQEFRIDQYNVHTIPISVSPYMLCVKDKDGVERQLRNIPRKT